MAAVETRFEELSALLGQPDVIANRGEFARLSKEHADLDELVAAWRGYLKVRDDMAQAEAMIEEGDAGLRDLARAELDDLSTQATELEGRVKVLLLPRDPNDGRNVLLE